MESSRVVDSSLLNHSQHLFSTNANVEGDKCLHKQLPGVLFAQLYVGNNHVWTKH